MHKETVMTFNEFKERAEMFPNNYILINTDNIVDEALGIIVIENDKKMFRQVEFTVNAFKVINR